MRKVIRYQLKASEVESLVKAEEALTKLYGLIGETTEKEKAIKQWVATIGEYVMTVTGSITIDEKEAKRQELLKKQAEIAAQLAALG